MCVIVVITVIMACVYQHYRCDYVVFIFLVITALSRMGLGPDSIDSQVLTCDYGVSIRFTLCLCGVYEYIEFVFTLGDPGSRLPGQVRVTRLSVWCSNLVLRYRRDYSDYGLCLYTLSL